MFSERFFGADPTSATQYRNTIGAAVDALLAALPAGACSGATAGELSELLGQAPAADPATGAHAIPQGVADIVRHSIAVSSGWRRNGARESK